MAYTLDRFGLTRGDVYECGDSITVPKNKKIIYEIDKWILAMVKAGIDIKEPVREFIAANKDAVVICNDIANGIVPVDPILRKWREEVGRSLAEISLASDEVARMFYGIPMRIK